MDFIADYLPQLQYFYSAYQASSHPYVAPIYRSILLAQSFLYRYIFPLIFPIYALANHALHTVSSDSPDLLTLLVLGIILIISLKVLDYMRRTLVSWISFMLRLSFWLAMAGAAVYVWQRGLERSIDDFGWLWGLYEAFNDEGQRVGSEKAKVRERKAQGVRAAQGGQKRRTRGGGW